MVNITRLCTVAMISFSIEPLLLGKSLVNSYAKSLISCNYANTRI